MTIETRSRIGRLVLLAFVLALTVGCAAQKAFTRAEREMRRENYDDAVLAYSKAVALDPGNRKYVVALERAKIRASSDHFAKGQRFAAAAQYERAVAEFQQTLLLNPANQHAANELERAAREIRRREAGPSELEQLKERARRANLGPPKLDPGSNIPIVLNFEEKEVGKIFEAMSLASGINFIFDDKVDLDKPLSIDIGNVTLEKALDILMLQTKNFYKVIDEYTLLIAPDTRQKRQEYEDRVIRTFFLSNADTKTVVTLLRSLLQSRQIAENADLNSVTIKDTPDTVAIAERIINANDKSKGEVIIDVELLEINRTLTTTLGLDLSSKALSLTFRDGDERLPLNNVDALRQSGSWTIGPIPSVTLDFLKSDSETKAIAKPQLRVSEGERAEILIGDRVPIPTTSFNTSQTVGGNIVPITSFTYQNVGITVQIEPRVHHNKEVTLSVQIEISQLSGSVSTGGGQEQPIIGTRQIQTVIRLRDGETNMLAGLIQRVDEDALSSIAGVGDVPILRRIFGRTSKTNRETDIVLTLTPRIIRIPDITEEDLQTLWVGTEEQVSLRGAARDSLSAGPFGRSNGGAAAAAIEASAGAEGRRAGSVVRMSESDEVDRDRAAAAAEREREAQAEDSRRQQDDAGAPPPPVPDEGATPEPPDDDPRRSEGEEEDDSPFGQEPPSGPAVVQLIPTKATYSVGETVETQVVISNASNVGSVPFHLRFDPSVLQWVAPAAEGPFMGLDGTEPVFLASEIGGGGEIVVGYSRLGAGRGAEGSGTLAIFRFVAVGPGAAGFAFTQASVKDPQASNLPAQFAAPQVEVVP